MLNFRSLPLYQACLHVFLDCVSWTYIRKETHTGTLLSKQINARHFHRSNSFFTVSLHGKCTSNPKDDRLLHCVSFMENLSWTKCRNERFTFSQELLKTKMTIT